MLSPSDQNSQISVVCPTYNSSAYITRALSSLLNQEEAPDQLIFCDDGSTDDTVAIVELWKKKFIDRDIDVTVNKLPHQGPGSARNYGLNLAKHSWIAFLDADDAWDSAKLRRVRSKINKTIEVNVVLHWEEKRHLDGRNSLLRHGEDYHEGLSISRLLYKKNIFSTSAVVCRRDILQSVGGFDPTLPNAQDYDLWLKASELMNLTVIPEVLGFCFEEATSITSRPYSRRYASRMKVAWRHRSKGAAFDWLIKLGKITFSRQWLALFR